MMPFSVSKQIKRLVYQLEVDYGDYDKYTNTLYELHTLIINDAQSFKPKRTYKKKEKPANDNGIPESAPVVRAPDTEEETP